MRHHSIVFSSIAATPCMALSYSDKVKNYMHDLSMDKYICDVRTNSSEEVYSTFKELVSSAHEVREHLKEAQKSNLIKWQKYLDTIEELI